MFVVVTGAPGAGKSTLATALADELGASYLSHDVIKERLADSLGVGDEDWGWRLTDAADDVFFELVPRLRNGVLDHWWRPPRYERLVALNLAITEVFCRCPLEELQARADARATTRARHPIHRDWLCPDVGERWGDVPGALEPLRLGPVVEVQTDRSVDISAVAAEVTRLTGG